MAGLPELGHNVLVTNRYPENLNFISTNHRAAMQEVTEYYLNLCGPPAQVFFLDPMAEGFVYRERKEGFIAACEKNRCFYRVCPVPGDFAAIQKAIMGLSFTTRQPVVMISSINACAGAVLTVARDRETPKAAILDFVEKYNAAADTATLTFAQNLDALVSPLDGSILGPGTFRLRKPPRTSRWRATISANTTRTTRVI
jgi:DNA-binding LacI/PurR family transcriptional regulator